MLSARQKEGRSARCFCARMAGLASHLYAVDITDRRACRPADSQGEQDPALVRPTRTSRRF